MNHTQEFRDAIAATGLVPPDEIIDDGKIHRFSSSGKRGDTAGWYLLHGDGIPAGRFGCNRNTDIDVKWRSNSSQELTPEQRAEYKRKMQAAKQAREADQQREREQAASQAADLYARAVPSDDHPYLKRKKITGIGARVLDGELLIPLRHGPGALVGLQRILPDGQKFFIRGTPSGGAYHVIGKPPAAGPIVICEGYATAISIHLATGYCVVIALNAGNLLAVSQKIRKALPQARILIAPDDDRWTDGNPGVTAARAAADAISASVVMPAWQSEPERGHTDFNDLHCDESLDAVRACFNTEPGPASDKPGRKPDSAPSPAAVPDVMAGAGDTNAGSSASRPPFREGAAVDVPDQPRVLAHPSSGADPASDDIPDHVKDYPAPSAPKSFQEILPAVTDQYAPECSDDDIATRHVNRMQQNALWCEVWGRWLCWNGSRWQRDETNLVLDMVRQTCRAISNDVLMNPDLDAGKRQRQADKIASYKTISAVEKLARTFRTVATHPDDWDKNNWALNTPGGVVDLRTGRMRQHLREDRFTKITNVTPGGDCPTWHRFLQTATGGNQELIGFLKRMCGYALTGDVTEHALFFVYGTGGNGKGTFLNTITRIMGDYQRVAGAETFTETYGERHTTEIADFKGARLVTAQETEEGKRWAESRIKLLTGGDPITARFMHKDNFTFMPQFKLVIVGNHKPSFRNVDDAIRRRLHMIPFTAVIAPEDKDPKLPSKLDAEAPGILKWMIEGCIEWLQSGLNPPEIVKKSTDEYLSAEDELSQWMDDSCTVSPSHFASSSALFASWSKFCEESGGYVGSQKRLLARLETRGISTGQKVKGVRGCVGIGLKSDYNTGF